MGVGKHDSSVQIWTFHSVSSKKYFCVDFSFCCIMKILWNRTFVALRLAFIQPQLDFIRSEGEMNSVPYIFSRRFYVHAQTMVFSEPAPLNM